MLVFLPVHGQISHVKFQMSHGQRLLKSSVLTSDRDSACLIGDVIYRNKTESVDSDSFCDHAMWLFSQWHGKRLVGIQVALAAVVFSEMVVGTLLRGGRACKKTCERCGVEQSRVLSFIYLQCPQFCSVLSLIEACLAAPSVPAWFDF
jgi:hypothetical protein